MRRARMAWMAVIAASAGCATLPARVPLVIDPAGKQLLAGEWLGEYESLGTGRSGSITFMLVEHQDSTVCRGDVLMIPRGANQAVQAIDGVSRPGEQQAPDLRVLSIDLLKVEGDHVTGTIQSYSDPETGHPISTTFDGRITGDIITGQLVSVDGRTGREAVGTWQVSRKRPKD